MEDPFTLDPAGLDLDSADQSRSSSQAPTPAESNQTQRKKRKAWGQPIPDFKVVLPPRKRAKTEEEKEQRKNERVIRNRKAADKSRQRQKAAVAELETRQARMEEENASLRAALAQYKARFGDLQVTTTTFPEPATTMEGPEKNLLAALNIPPPPSLVFEESPLLSMTTDATSVAPSPVPTLSLGSPRLSASTQHVPSFTTSLFAPQDLATPMKLEPQDPILSLADFSEDSGMTQYPAAILCDLQCQPELSMEMVQQLNPDKQFNFSLHLINLTILMTIYETFSTSILSPMCKIFRTLAENLSMTSIEPDLLDSHFPLIHSLISSPTSRTTRPVFRMKLLSRLLACSPRMARLIEAATDRALQRVVSDDAFFDDPRVRQQWASLLTTKWAIRRLDREHERYRLMVEPPGGTVKGSDGVVHAVESIKMLGVDYLAVERTLWRWRSENLDLPMGESLVSGPDVH